MPSLAPASGAVRPQLTGAAAQRRPRTAYLLLLPGLAWLGIFFVVPIVSLFFTSLQAPTEQAGIYQPALQVSNYLVALQDYWPQLAHHSRG